MNHLFLGTRTILGNPHFHGMGWMTIPHDDVTFFR